MKHPIEDISTINFVLTKSRVSAQKRQRILHLIHTVDDFKLLSGPIWENTSSRESISRSAISLERHQGDMATEIDLEDYESAWAVLQLVSMDSIYLTKTAYNIFSLMRLGNRYSKIDQVCYINGWQRQLLILTSEPMGHFPASQKDITTGRRALPAREIVRPDCFWVHDRSHTI